MKNKAYDVFISYRRENGREIARTLQQGLTQRGLRVFFDLEEIRDGKFNEALYDSIDTTKNLIIIMTTGALDRCANDGDWVRRELEHAFGKGVNVIPVLPSGHQLRFPANLPNSLGGLTTLQVATLDLETLFNESVDKLVSQRLKDVCAIGRTEFQEAEQAFLSRARRFKENDGVIDDVERADLHEFAKTLGLSDTHREVLIEKIEAEAAMRKMASMHARGDYTLIDTADVTRNDVEGTISLDHLVYSDEYIPSCDRICEWTNVNPDIDFIVRDNVTHDIVAYAEAMPVTDECYEDLRSGKIVDMDLMAADKILSYDMPGAYNVYFASIVIHPQYRNTVLFKMLFDEMVRRYIRLIDNEVFVKRILADALSPEGEKFCRLFGMRRIDSSNHHSTLYEVSLMPPQFRLVSQAVKELRDRYAAKYEEMSWMFEDKGTC